MSDCLPEDQLTIERTAKQVLQRKLRLTSYRIPRANSWFGLSMLYQESVWSHFDLLEEVRGSMM
jgi:hypothetical protein